MANDCAIGIDVGGTNIKAARVKNSSIISDILVRDTPKDLESFKLAIFEIIRTLDGDKSSQMGISIPGLIDHDQQKMIKSPNLPFLNGMKLYEILPDYQIKYGNDADMSLLGEIAASKLNDEKVLLLTLGTGIGSAFCINGIGSWQIDFAGEFGHMKVVPDGRPCPCGGFGCIESYFSGRSILLEGQRSINPSPSSVHEIFDLAKHGNKTATEIIRSGIDKLGIAIANSINLVGFDTVIISGKIAKSYDFFIQDLKESVRKNTFNFESRKIEIRKSEMVGKAGIIGAATKISSIKNA